MYQDYRLRLHFQIEHGNRPGLTEIRTRVAANAAYQNAMKRGDKQNARIEHDKALGVVIVEMMNDDAELFKQFVHNGEFQALDNRYGVWFDLRTSDVGGLG